MIFFIALLPLSVKIVLTLNAKYYTLSILAGQVFHLGTFPCRVLSIPVER
jgi:hypothetical protein